MKRITLFLVLLGLLLSVIHVYAEGDMTQPEFMISLDLLDPLAGSHESAGPMGVNSIFVILEGFSRLLLYMIPVIAITSVLIAGYYYIFSAGDAEKAGRGKKIIQWNLVAIAVALFSWSIIKFIALLFSSY